MSKDKTKLTLTGKIRSTQSIYKTVCMKNHPRVYMTTEGKDIKEEYKWQVMDQYDGDIVTSDMAAHIKLFFPTRHRRDIDNYNKLLLDSLEGIVYKDDKQIQKLAIEKLYDKENPRIELEIWKLSS